LVVKYETTRMALLPSVRVMDPVVAVSAEPLEAYHAAFVGKLVLLRFPSAHVSSRITTAWLGIARPTIAAITKTLQRRRFIENPSTVCIQDIHGA